MSYEDKNLQKKLKELFDKGNNLDDKEIILKKILYNIKTQINDVNKENLYVVVELDKCERQPNKYNEGDYVYNIILSCEGIRILKIYLENIIDDIYILLSWSKLELAGNGDSIRNISSIMEGCGKNPEKLKTVINNILNYGECPTYKQTCKGNVSKGYISTKYEKAKESKVNFLSDFSFKFEDLNETKIISSLIKIIRYLSNLTYVINDKNN